MGAGAAGQLRGAQMSVGGRPWRASGGCGPHLDGAKQWGKGVRTRGVGAQDSTFGRNSFISKMEKMGTSLVVQWLRLRVAPAGGAGSIPEQGNKIPTCNGSGMGVAKKNFF